MVYSDEKSMQPVEGRFRSYNFLVYDDSAPSGWLDYIYSLHIPGFIQYHDRDILADGSPKKPHWHLLILFEGVKSTSQVDSLFSHIAANGCIFLTHSIRGYSRYLCHLDEESRRQEKPLYPSDSVIALSGACYQTMIELPEDVSDLLNQIVEFCVNHEMTNFGQLVLYAAAHRSDWFYSLVYHGALIRSTLTSLAAHIKESKEKGCSLRVSDLVHANFSIALSEGAANRSITPSPALRGSGGESPVTK